MTIYQSMQMACTGGPGGFWVNEIDMWLIDYYDETVAKNGAGTTIQVF
jgi:hypothetical protein